MKMRILVLMTVGFMLQGCVTNMDSPSVVNVNKVQVSEEQYFQELDIEELNQSTLTGIAYRYARQGSGGLVVNVTHGGARSAMWARGEAMRIAAVLKRNGVEEVRADILPLKGETRSRVLVSYRSYDALAPEGCGMMPGYHSPRLKHDPDYKIGCSVETMYAMQIARPKDLIGQSDMGYGDGRRAANVAENYRLGVPNSALGGESASGE